MKLKQFLKNRLFWLFLGFIVIYLIFLIAFRQYKDLWWDSAVYIGAGKYIFSGGTEGVFQPIIYPFLPLMLGFFWFIGFKGFSIVYAGKFLILIFSLLSLLLTYLIAKKLFDKRTGVIAMNILFFNSLFFLFMFRIYTEMITLCFMMASIFFTIKFSEDNKKGWLFLSALFLTILFLTKYTNITFLLILEAYIACFSYKSKKINSFLWFNLFFALLMLPFFIFNYAIFGNPLYMINIFQNYLVENLPTLYSFRSFPAVPRLLFENTDFIYFKSILYLFNILLPFTCYGLYRIFQDKKNISLKLFMIIIPAIFIFLVAEISYLKQERYILAMFPMLAMITGYGLTKVKFKLVTFIMVVYICSALVFSGHSLWAFSTDIEYANLFINPPIKISCENATTADPRTVINYKTNFPYDVFDEKWDGSKIRAHGSDCVFYFSCSKQVESQLSEIKSLNYSLEYYSDRGSCYYAIFKKINS